MRQFPPSTKRKSLCGDFRYCGNSNLLSYTWLFHCINVTREGIAKWERLIIAPYEDGRSVCHRMRNDPKERNNDHHTARHVEKRERRRGLHRPIWQELINDSDSFVYYCYLSIVFSCNRNMRHQDGRYLQTLRHEQFLLHTQRLLRHALGHSQFADNADDGVKHKTEAYRHHAAQHANTRNRGSVECGVIFLHFSIEFATFWEQNPLTL